MGSSRVGSNPTRSEIFFRFFLTRYCGNNGLIKMTTMGIEPTIFRFEVGRLIHWATRPYSASCLYTIQCFVSAINVLVGENIFGHCGPVSVRTSRYSDYLLRNMFRFLRKIRRCEFLSDVSTKSKRR